MILFFFTISSNLKLSIIPLHSSISSEAQKDIFKNAAPGYRKVILATNIAESSITIPNVAYVLDFCLTRTLEADSSSGFSTLKLDWASRNSCMQRAGRTGRTRSGRCYRLVSRSFYEVSIQNKIKINKKISSCLKNKCFKIFSDENEAM